jgi:predicted AAA+ superfamily ATPase
MKRDLQKSIKTDLESKFVLLSGPRQVGKTTLAKSLFPSIEYLNFDHLTDRKKILRAQWDRTKDLIVLDEIHKMKKWKQWLKGIYDTEENTKIIVTGSARLDTHKKVGDSMAGRYFQYNLFPLDLKELKSNGMSETQNNLDQLLKLSGFPEPFLSGSEQFYRRWRKTHLDIIIKQDLIELESIKRLTDIGTLVELMTERIGSPLSYNSLREDLSTDDKTVKRWCMMLENTYVFFKITPYFKSLKSALRKSPKYYFYDYPRVDDTGARLENFVALSLYKEISYRNDVLGENYHLHYLRDRQHHEVDFLICKDKKPVVMIEVKNGESAPSPHFHYFDSDLVKQNPNLKRIQLVKTLKRNYSTPDGLLVTNLGEWLEKMDFC